MKAESRRHMRRMLNSRNLDRITCFAQASTRRDWAGIAPSFLTVDATWNCNYDCRGCIDTTARDGSPVVRKKQGGDPLCVDAGACEGPSLSWKALEGVIRFVKEAKLNGVQLMGGESLLHPQIDPFVEELAHNRIPVEIVTNGSLIHMHLAALCNVLGVDGSWLRVSINGWRQYGERVGWPARGADLRRRVISGIRTLIQELPEERRDRVFVSTVAFRDALADLGEICRELCAAGIKRMVVIREREPQLKEFLLGQEHVRDSVRAKVDEIRAELAERLQVSVADNILVDPVPQTKDYQPCPSVILKTLLGADGYIYACTDHRGCEYARLANIADHGSDMTATWKSSERVQGALAYFPSRHCTSIVCQRFEGNVAISMLRNDHHTWTF